MNSVFSSSFWFSSNTPRRWTEIDVYEIGGGGRGGPGPGHPYAMHTNIHVFHDYDRGITPDKRISKPSFFIHKSRLADAYNTYAVDWDKNLIQWLFNGRVVRTESNKGHHQWLRLKLDSESFVSWFGLPSPSFRMSDYRVNYVRGWTKRSRWRRSGSSRGDPSPQTVGPATVGAPGPARAAAVGLRTVRVGDAADTAASAAAGDDDEGGFESSTVDAATLVEDVGVSPWALQRAPSPGSSEKILRSPPVPFGGWDSLAGRVGRSGRSAARGVQYWPPRVPAADTFGTWNAGD